METECQICLDQISVVDETGLVPCCKTQIYHKDCIFTWSTKSNHCPTCRSKFHNLETYKKGGVSKVINIPDKLNKKQEHRNNNTNLTYPFEETSVNNVICCICALTNTTSQSDISCPHCGCNFHINCLGFNMLEENFVSWYCPMCDYYNQDTILPMRSARSKKSVNMKKKTNKNLIVHNLNNEIDDDFLYTEFSEFDNENETVPSNVINGGVISRREIKQRENLTQEEITSWDIFEKIRSKEIPNEFEAETAHVNTQSDRSKPQRRKRKKITPLTDTQPTIIPMSTGPSRINQLLNVATQQPSSISPNSTSPMDSDSFQYSSDDNEYTKHVSLDQKKEIESLIQAKLTVRYNTTSQRFSTRILNKLLASTELEEILNDESKLNELIDLYID